MQAPKLFALTLFLAARSAAAAGEATDPAYAPWGGRGPYPAPGAPPLGRPPPPTTAGSRYFRRPVELIPQLSFAVPACQPGDVSNDRCSGVTWGLGAGFGALWRVAPHFAWGGSFDLAFFGNDPPNGGSRTAGAASAWIGLLGRVYFFDEGSVDPWVQVGFGGAALGTAFEDASSEPWRETGAGPALQVGGGLDFFLGPRLRLGPSLLLTRVFVDKISRCHGNGERDCSELRKEDHGYLNAVAVLGASLTIMLGDEL